MRRLIDLRKGHPKAANLPHKLLAQACRAAANRLDASSEEAFRLSYPVGSHGTPAFLKQLARFLRESYGGPVLEDGGLFTTNGVSHGLDIACAALTRPGDVVWTEIPTYFLATQIFRDHHLNVRGVPSDAHGLDTDALAAALASGSNGPAPKLLYLVPTHGNPSGATLPLARREALVKLARQYSFIALTDDVYHLLDWSREAGGQAAVDPPPRLLALDPAYQRATAAAAAGATMGVTSVGDVHQAKAAAAKASAAAGNGEEEQSASIYAQVSGAGGAAGGAAGGLAADDGCVVSCGSFTKILAPGLRVGWLEAAPALVDKIAARGYLDSGGSVAPFASEVLVEMMAAGGHMEALAHLKQDYLAGSRALCAALRAAGCFEVANEPTGGYFIWVKLPEGVHASALLPVAERHGVVFLPGPVCAPDASRPEPALESYVRLCFAYEEVAELEEGARRLGRAVEEVRAGGGAEAKRRKKA